MPSRPCHPRPVRRLIVCLIAVSCAVVQPLGDHLSAPRVADAGQPPAAAASTAQEPSLDDLLQKPLTPGVVALLVEQSAGDARVQERLRGALKAPEPAVRAVAARVVLILGLKSHARYLVPALAEEEYVLPAHEQLRALMHLPGPAGDDLALREAWRVGGWLPTTFAEVMGRQRPDTLVSVLPTLDGREPRARDEEGVRHEGLSDGASEAEAQERHPPSGRVLAMVAVQHPEHASTLTSAVVSHGDRDVRMSFLEALAQWEAPPDADALVEALETRDDDVRGVAVWSLVSWRSAGRTLPSAVVTAVAEGERVASWEGFGRELVRRMEGYPKEGEWASVLATVRDGAPRELSRVDQRLLTNDERTALRDAGFAVDRMRARAVSAARERPYETLRTAPDIAPGLLPELMSLTDCRPGGDTSIAATRIAYRPDGIPAQISLDESLESTGCAHVQRVLARLSVAPEDLPIVDGTTDTHLFLFDEELLACGAQSGLADMTIGELPPRTIGDGPEQVKRPERTRQVQPEYPRRAQQARIQGVVILDAVVMDTGCVQSIKVRYGVHPLLDVAAMRAVSGWRYTSTLVGGRPVPVTMTVTVNFTLE